MRPTQPAHPAQAEFDRRRGAAPSPPGVQRNNGDDSAEHEGVAD